MGHDTVEIKTRSTPWLSHNPWWKDGFEFFDHTGSGAESGAGVGVKKRPKADHVSL